MAKNIEPKLKKIHEVAPKMPPLNFSQKIPPNPLTNYETSCIIITYQDKLSRNMAR